MRAVGVEFFTRIAGGELDPAQVDDNGEFGMVRMGDMMATRTRFLDDFFMAAAGDGISRAVILASGLDARAYRLPVAGPNHRVRDRPGPGHRIQDRGPGRAGRLADRRTARRARRPSPRLAGDAVQTMADRMRGVTDQWRKQGFDVEMTHLWYAGDRNDVVEYLSAHGWVTASDMVSELFPAQGISLSAGPDDKNGTLTGLQ